MPMLFEVARDPSLGNPNVIVRRTARQKAPVPGLNCYLAIEFTWFQSGSLGVCTSVNPIDPTDQPPTGLTPFFDNAEIRVFKPAIAERFSKVSSLFSEGIDFGHFPHPSSFCKLPADFLDPPDDYYTLSIREPRDPVYRSSLIPAYIKKEQSFHAQDDFAGVRNDGTNPQELFAGAIMHCDRGDVSSVASPHTITLWNGYQQAVAHSRRTGLFSTMVAKKLGGRFGKVSSLFGRDVRYTFLSTSGINVHGRIQRLCNQLGIVCTSPLPDPALMSPTTVDGGSSANSPVPFAKSSETDVDSELDITSPTFGRMELPKRKMDQLHKLDGHQPYLAGGKVGFAGGRQPRGNVPSHGSDPSTSVQSTEGSLQRSISQSASTDLLHSYSESNSRDQTRPRKPKRPRYSPASSIRTTEPRGDPGEETLRLARANGVQGERKNPLLQHNEGSERQANLNEQVRKSDESAGTKQITSAVKSSVRRRSFDITDMLSDDSKYYASSSTRSEAVSSTPNSTAVGIHTKVAPISQVRDQNVPQNGMQSDAKGSDIIVKPETGIVGSTKKGAGTVWTCDRCGVQIRGKKGNLNRHIANKHDNIRAYACKVPNCGRKFQTRLNLVRHETAVHLGRPHTCSSCPRAFKYESDLQGHIKSAHENAEATLACDICGSCFGRRSTLNRHKAKVHKHSDQQRPTIEHAIVDS